MIEVVSGLVGSGKSHDVVRFAINHVCSGGIVASNIDFDRAAIESIYHRRLSPSQFLHIDADTDPATIPRGDFRGRGSRRVLVILDEALNWFQSEVASGKDARKAAWSRWLRQSDKLGQHVIFIAQNFERAAKWIRELAAVAREVVAIKDLRVLRLPVGRWLGLGRVYFVRSWDVRSQSSLGVDFHVYTPKVWRCYDTAALYGFVASSNAYDGLALYPAWRSPRLVVFSLVSSFLGVFYVLAA